MKRQKKNWKKLWNILKEWQSKNLENIEFLGYVNDVPNKIKESDIIIGAGRVAVEAILSGRPVIAVGEAKYIGCITPNNLSEGLKSNFGDIDFSEQIIIDSKTLTSDIETALNLTNENLLNLREMTTDEFDLYKIVDKIEKIYSKTYVEKKKYAVRYTGRFQEKINKMH